MKKIIISAVALAMFSIGDLAAQAQTRVFTVIDHMHIPEGKSADDYIAVEKLWQRVHQKKVDAGICLNWALYKVENGGRTDFVTIQTYDSLDKSTTPNGLNSLPKDFFSSDEEKVMQGTWASRDIIFEEVVERVTAVGNTGRVDLSLVGVIDYMKGKPGKHALDIEKTIYSKVAAANVKNGSMQKWFVHSRMYPSGSDLTWNYGTGNWYTKEQMAKSWDGAAWQKTVEAALGKEEAAKLPPEGTWRTRVMSQIWRPILATEPRAKK